MILALVLVVTGTISTISLKWMDEIKAVGTDGILRPFTHPFVQINFMFIGEFFCLIAFLIIFNKLAGKKNGSENKSKFTKGSRAYNRFLLIPPALMDMLAMSLLYFGLSFTSASSFYMLRGAVLVFTAVISMIVFKRKLAIREYIGIALIVIALIVIGFSDRSSIDSDDTTAIKPPGGTDDIETTTVGEDVGVPTEETATEPETVPDPDPETEPEGKSKVRFKIDIIGGSKENSDPVSGNILVIVAQLITACQNVYEEMFINKLDITPLEMVGYEGVFGFVILSLLIIPLNFIPNFMALGHTNSNGMMEDFIDAFAKIGYKIILVVPIAALILFTAFYNFAGVSITKEMNATSRMVFDSLRVMFVWLLLLAFGWQSFHYLQVNIF